MAASDYVPDLQNTTCVFWGVHRWKADIKPSNYGRPESVGFYRHRAQKPTVANPSTISHSAQCMRKPCADRSYLPNQPTFTPFQKAIRSRMFSALDLGLG